MTVKYIVTEEQLNALCKWNVRLGECPYDGDCILNSIKSKRV